MPKSAIRTVYQSIYSEFTQSNNDRKNIVTKFIEITRSD